MEFSSLADELDNALDELVSCSIGDLGVGRAGPSLADEFGFEERPGPGDDADSYDHIYSYSDSLEDRHNAQEVEYGENAGSQNYHGGDTLELELERLDDGSREALVAEIANVDEPINERLYGVSGTDANNAEDDGRILLQSQDEIAFLNASVQSTSQLVSLLRDLDNGSEAGVPIIPQTVVPGSPTAHKLITTTSPISLEIRLQRHLALVSDCERAREEQTREVVALTRDLDGVLWDDIEMDWDWLQVLERVQSEDESPGWTGEIFEDWNHVNQQNNDHSEAEDADNLPHPQTLHSSFSQSVYPCPVAPVSPLASLSPTLLSPHAQLHRYNQSLTDTSPRPSTPLSRATSAIDDLSRSLGKSFSALTDTVEYTLALSTASARKTRGIRLAVEAWYEREAQEEACQRGVDLWEERKASRSATVGVELGVRTAREITRDLCYGFQQQLDECERRMAAVRAIRASSFSDD